MKKFLLAACSFLLLISCFGAFYDGPLPPRKILLDNRNVLKITGNTKDLEIVVEQNALPITVFAAQELQKFLQKSLAAEIPVVNKPSPGKISWIIGLNTWSRKAGIAEKDLIPEAFRILRKGRKIYIAGRDGRLVPRMNRAFKHQATVKEALRDGIWMQYHEHATLFGVYDFLERFVGVRFYFTGKYGTIVPRKKQLILPGIDIFDRPDLQMRYTDPYYGAGADSKNMKTKSKALIPLFITPERNLAFWRNRASTDLFSAMHGENKLYLIERFAKDHPEYFALREDKSRMLDRKKYGQFAPQICTSSKVVDEIYLDAKAALTGETPASRGMPARFWPPGGLQKNNINLSYNDGMYCCRCEKCLPAYLAKDPKKLSTFLWKFQAGIARRLREEKIPGYVSTLAYTTTAEVPDIPLSDNLVVDLSLNRGAYVFSRSIRQRKHQLRLMKAWRDKIGADRLWLSCYVGKLGAQIIPTLPDFCHRAIGKYYSHVKEYTNVGFMLCGGSENHHFGYLNRYIFHRIAWDKNCDWQKILSEHYKLMFGKAAPILEEIYNELEDIWLENIAAKFTATSVGDIPVVPSDRDIWTKIYSPELLKKLSDKFDRAEKSTAPEPEIRERIRFFRSQLLTPMQKYSANFLARSSDTLGFRTKLPLIREKILLDGKLKEKAWQKASILTLRPFQKEPGFQYPAASAAVMEDARYLYLGVRLAEPDDKLFRSTPVRKRDERDMWRDNAVEIFLKPEKSGKTFYQFMVNLKGSISDIKVTSTGRTFTPDFTWQSNAAAAYQKIPGGVVLEIRIPKKNVPGLDKNNFHFNLIRGRWVDGKCAMMSWSPFLKVRYHEPDAFGLLERKSELPNFIKDHEFSKPVSTRGKWMGPWECSPKHWNKPCVALDQEHFILGSQSLRMTQTGTSGKYFGVSQYLTMLKPNTRYRISYYLKTRDIRITAKNGGVCVGIRDNGNHWLPSNRIYGTNDWQYLSFDFTTSEEANRGRNHVVLSCFMYGVQPGSTAWFDGVRVEELGTAWSSR